MERLRQGMGSDYATLTHPEMEATGWIFGELWAYVAHIEWEELHFSKLDLADVKQILSYAKEVANHTRNSVDVLNDIGEIVRAKR